MSSRLTPCPDCETAVSPRARTCPRCGAELRITGLQAAGRALGSFVKLIIAVIAFGALGQVILGLF